MQILTQSLREKLLANGRQQQPLRGTAREIDFVPVVKLFTPDAGATWLLTEIDPDDPDIAFGLCDLGLGCPEIGIVSLAELSSLRGPLGLTVERDLYFEAEKPLSVYVDEARRLGCIRV
ncbi:DUF2958 domain-containing protein [Mesorhizobium abyssinicae]|uniref:DUF2958 domain-containing protein n=1 Tax=Mesorhizobium abyssinicae TaxID=1209958 RepID=UPI002A23A0B7|nr:DUF2958 domain-containing protein [Mesorhizobium abyssinicae]MDX8437119.1 DUF2958 domain-containing protein [Mesorhizobium abyssinicae]